MFHCRKSILSLPSNLSKVEHKKVNITTFYTADIFFVTIPEENRAHLSNFILFGYFEISSMF